ncbi:MAG: DUF2505 domain-containing protein [Pseudomonadota bacterium]|nr:DUF2505 domain-containing protein [Pseudomonadota bacterium]
MEVAMEHPYEAGIDAVLGAFFDKQHILFRNEQLGCRNVRIVDLKRDDVTAKVVVERELALKMNVPGILASVNRDWSQIRHEEHWFRKDAGEWHCEFRVRIKGLPVRIRGSMQLQGDASRCTNLVTLDIYCDVPLFGKQIAGVVVDDTRARIHEEYKAIRNLLQ